MADKTQLLNEVAGLYSWLDSQIKDYNKPDGLCSACGNCCNFKEFDHLLFVTGPELIYLASNCDDKQRLKMFGNTCPWNLSASSRADESGKPAIRTAGKCTIYNYRFCGCRIFCCKADKDLQVALSESAIKRLKSICEKFDVPYTYTDLKTALDNFNG